MFRLNPLRTPSPDILTLDQPPPNPYADEKIPGEADVFRRLLKQRLRVDEEEIEDGMGVDEAADYAWTRFSWPKRHLWVEALRPPASRTKALRNPDGLIGEALCQAYLDAWAQEGDSVLKLPKGIQLVGTDTGDMAHSNAGRARSQDSSGSTRNRESVVASASRGRLSGSSTSS